MVQSEENPSRWEDGDHVTDYNPYTGEDDTAYPQTRWIDEIQNDFATRADWCVMSYEEANHAPVVSLTHRNDLQAASGETVRLSGEGEDPDGDSVSYRWWQYNDVDSYPGEVQISNNESASASLMIPDDAQPGETIHIIFEMTDNNTPPLTRYQRVVITVEE